MGGYYVMSSELSEAIRNLVNERGISKDVVIETVKDVLLAAYKRKFGTSDNAVVNSTKRPTVWDLYAIRKSSMMMT